VTRASTSAAGRSAKAVDAPPWRRFLARHWERSPGSLALGAAPLLPLDEVFALAVRAAAPFRDGTRSRAIPDVRFFTGASRLRAPGDQLPSSADRTLARYLARMQRAHREGGFQLQIIHPLLLDFELWARTRAWLAGILAQVGVPVMPITCELLLGTWPAGPSGRDPVRTNHAALTVVLEGELTATIRSPLSGGRTKQTTLRGGRGELLLWPAGAPHQDEGRGCAALRLWIATQGADVAEAVKDVAVALMERRLGDHHRVPYVPLPATASASASQASSASGRARAAAAPPLVEAAQLLAELSLDDLPRALQIQWAKRVSASALEPVPAPLEPRSTTSGLPAGAVVQLTAAPLRMPLGNPGEEELAIWAVHGHAFSVRDEARAQAVLARLRAGPLRLAELEGQLRPAAEELIGQLLRLRAATLTTPPARAARAMKLAPAKPARERRGAR
jgi:hypothetical protein